MEVWVLLAVIVDGGGRTSPDMGESFVVETVKDGEVTDVVVGAEGTVKGLSEPRCIWVVTGVCKCC